MTKNWEVIQIRNWGKVDAGRQRSFRITKGEMRPYLRVANVFDGFIDTSNVFQMPFSDSEFKKYKLIPGDILLNEGQSLELVGRSAIYQGNPPNCAFQNTLIRFRPGSRCDVNFAQLLFQYLQYTGKFSAIAKQTTSIAHLGVNRFADLWIEIPNIDEQRRIANVLLKWDKAIALTEKLIAAKRRLKQGLMQQLLTGKRRFPEFSQDTWESKPLEEIVYIQMGTSPASQFYNNEKCGLPLVQGMSSILNGYAEPKIWTRQITQTALPNDILLSVRAPVGVAAKTQQQICIGRGIASLRSKEGINQEFIFQALQFSELKWRKLVRGSTFEAVTSAEVKKFAISTPSSYEEQCKIAQFLKLFDDEIVLNCRLLKLLISQKNGLMQKLLTGDIRIPVSEDTP